MERVMLKERVKSLAACYEYKLHGQPTIEEGDFYSIKEQLRVYDGTGWLRDSEVESIFSDLGYRVDRLPPIDQRGDDGFDNALDWGK